jgi:hypothetical protein
MQGSDLLESLGTPQNQQNASVLSENLNDESTLSQDQKNATSLLLFVHSLTCEEHNDLRS